MMRDASMNDEAETGRIRAIDLSYSETLYYLGSPYSKHHAGIEGAFQEISAIAARLIERGSSDLLPDLAFASYRHSWRT